MMEAEMILRELVMNDLLYRHTRHRLDSLRLLRNWHSDVLLVILGSVRKVYIICLLFVCCLYVVCLLFVCCSLPVVCYLPVFCLLFVCCLSVVCLMFV